MLVIISLSVHEAAHAWVAWLRGDDTAKSMGRMTVNPLVHIDPFMTIILPAITIYTAGFLFGGAKPVPVMPSNFKNPNRDNALVAVAGPISNLLLALFFFGTANVLVRFDFYDLDQLLPKLMFAAGFANVILAVFNMLPIPPLDGSRVVSWLLPRDLRQSYDALERFGLLIIVGLFMGVPSFGNMVRKTIQTVTLYLASWVDAIMGLLPNL